MARVRGGAVAALAVGGLLLTAAPVQAHDSLVSVSPADGATVTQPPAAVVLEFSGVVEPLGSGVLVRGSDGRTMNDGTTRVSGTTVTQKLLPLDADGTYEVAWRVVSSDGHPVSGTTTFVAQGLGPRMAERAEEESRGRSGALGRAPLVGLALVVVAALATLALLRGRRKARV